MTEHEIKNDDALVGEIINRRKWLTARIDFEGDVEPDDTLILKDEDGEKFAEATVAWTGEMAASFFVNAEFEGHQTYDRVGEFLAQLRVYYPDRDIYPETEVLVIAWDPNSLQPVFGYDTLDYYEDPRSDE